MGGSLLPSELYFYTFLSDNIHTKTTHNPIYGPDDYIRIHFGPSLGISSLCSEHSNLVLLLDLMVLCGLHQCGKFGTVADHPDVENWHDVSKLGKLTDQPQGCAYVT
jgi:hypothetical protein